MKKILLIVGSPRKNGLTSSLITVFKKKINELNSSIETKINVDILFLSDYKILQCNGCDACLKKPFKCPLCKIEGDNMEKLEDAMKQADAIIIGAPSYFSGPPGILKDLLDRSRAMKMAKYQLKNKYFSCITVSGLRSGGQTEVADNLNRYALTHGMIVVGALGHPVLVQNIPGGTLQKLTLKDFRKPSEPGDVAVVSTKSLAERIFNLLK